LINVDIAGEGFDEPSIEMICLARPTLSRAKCCQMIGRGTRPIASIAHHLNKIPDGQGRRELIASSSKPAVEILDFVGNSGRHKLMTPADILGGEYDDEIVERAKDNVRKKAGEPANMTLELQFAQEQIHAERKAKREAAERERKVLIGKAEYTVRKISPFDIFDIEPVREKGWNKGKQVSEAMANVLVRNGFDPATLSYTHAKQVVSYIIENPDKIPATEKQKNFLKKRGYDTDGMSKQEAGAIIGPIMEQWRGQS
jgi:type I site-specific restriction endonuclease